MRDAELTRKAVRLVRMLRMQGLLDAAQERTALDEVSAPGERVLPEREVSPPPPPALPAHDEPAALPPTGAPSTMPPDGEPTPAPSPSAEPEQPSEPATPGSAAAQAGSDR